MAIELIYRGTGSGAVKSVNGMTGEVILTAEDIGAATKEYVDNAVSNVDIPSIEPADGDIPKVFIDGVIPTTKDDVLATLQYVSKTEEFFAYIKIKCQGTSSMSYPKKNFTIKLYSDEARETKIKKVFKDWGIAESKFVLKANYIDHSHARNIVSARLWNEVVSSESDIPEELKASPNNGAVDGFPVKIYTNGTYQGIYTWNIGKDAWMWNMDEDNPNHVLLCAETNTDGAYRETPCNFRALWSGVDEQNWSIEVGTNSAALKNSLNALITCVKDTDDETFKATIGNYLDVNSAIDYYIHQYVICGLDGLAKNMLLGTYDLVKWRCGAYDMDSTFGLWWNGTKFVAANFACPEDYQEQFSLLWERIEKLFTNELKERYFNLRKSVYSLSNMFTHFERFTDLIGSELYAEDVTIYTGIPLGSTNNIKQIRNYIRDRLVYCDGEFAAMGEEVEPEIPDEPDTPINPGDSLLYSLPSETEFDGVANYVDTGVTLFKENTDFTIALEFTGSGTANKSAAVFHCVKETMPYPGASLDISNGKYRFVGNDLVTSIMSTDKEKHRVVVVKDANAKTIKLYWDTISNMLNNTNASVVTGIFDKPLILGAKKYENGMINNFWSGIIHNCSVYSKQFTTEEIESYLTA